VHPRLAAKSISGPNSSPVQVRSSKPLRMEGSVSRAYDARRKAKRKQARIAREDATDARRWHPSRAIAAIPALVIAAILATVGVLGFGGTTNAADKTEIQQRVNRLLAGIPQQGATLGSPKAPITLWVYADLECPTVRRFVTAYLPSIIRTWVRDGTVKLEYRSLRTDTYDERTFFNQEAAALAVGRQNKMWNYALTFIHEQGETHTNYATDEFLADIASQVPGLSRTRWQHDRQDSLLSKRVARELHFASTQELRSTPSFSLAFGGATDSVRKEVEASLNATVDALVEESSGDAPSLGFFGAQQRNLEEIGVP
jgi:protein-disulfide isomerase